MIGFDPRSKANALNTRLQNLSNKVDSTRYQTNNCLIHNALSGKL